MALKVGSSVRWMAGTKPGSGKIIGDYGDGHVNVAVDAQLGLPKQVLYIEKHLLVELDAQRKDVVAPVAPPKA